MVLLILWPLWLLEDLLLGCRLRLLEEGLAVLLDLGALPQVLGLHGLRLLQNLQQLHFVFLIKVNCGLIHIVDGGAVATALVIDLE